MRDTSIPDLSRNPYFSCRIGPSIFIREIRRHSPIVDLSQLNFVTRAQIRSTASLLPSVADKVSFEGQDWSPFEERVALRFLRRLPLRNQESEKWYDRLFILNILLTQLQDKRMHYCSSNNTIVYIWNFALFAEACAGFNRCFAHSWHSPNHFIISLFESFRSGCI